MYIVHVSRVLDRQLLNGGCHGDQNWRLCSRPHSHESLTFSYFWDSDFFDADVFFAYNKTILNNQDDGKHIRPT